MSAPDPRRLWQEVAGLRLSDAEADHVRRRFESLRRFAYGHPEALRAAPRAMLGDVARRQYARYPVAVREAMVALYCARVIVSRRTEATSA